MASSTTSAVPVNQKSLVATMPQSARVEGEEKRIQKKKVQAKEEKETKAAEDNKKLKSPTTFLSDRSGIRKNLYLKFWDCAIE